MSCCRNHFTGVAPSENTKKMRILARLYTQMRSGTDIQPGDWLKVKIGLATWRLIYKGDTPITSTCSVKAFPWEDCVVVSLDPKKQTLPFREMKDSDHAPLNTTRIESFEITAPFAYPAR